MVDEPVLRVFAFAPSRPGLIDAVLRDELLPELAGLPDVIDAYAARHGPGDVGERVVVSVWASREAMDTQSEEAGILAAHPQLADGSETMRLMAEPLAISLSFERAEEARILRVFEGEVRDGRLAEYVASVYRGTLADADENPGLIALYLAARPDARFLTVSAWTGWDAIEAATGGDVVHPIRTRSSDRVTILNVTHYEVLPGIARPAMAHARDEAAAV
jgi:hypothetical protein